MNNYEFDYELTGLEEHLDYEAGAMYDDHRERYYEEMNDHFEEEEEIPAEFGYCAELKRFIRCEDNDNIPF